MRQERKKFHRILATVPFVIAALFAASLIYINHFNSLERTSIGNDTTKSTYMEISDRGGGWVKSQITLYGETVDLYGKTVDEVLYNNSKYPIENWSLKINIKTDCFMNGMWNSNEEIHQNVNGDEKVQSINLNKLESWDELTLDYTDDGEGDLLIPLYVGDYLIYTPSKDASEIPVAKENEVKMGFNIYYFDVPDFSSYELTYNYDRKFVGGINFYVICGMTIVWFIFALMFTVSENTYRRTVKELESKKSGMLSMSDIYAIIYVVDLKKDELMPLKADEESEKLRPKNIGAGEQLANMCQFDCVESYIDVAKEFCDLTTIADRLEERNTIVFEYQSNVYGWCRMRFFAIDRVEGQPLEKVIYTLQVINTEKAEVEEITKKVHDVEMESKAKSIFLANMSHEIRTPINTVIGLDTMILRESGEKRIKSYARDIKSAATMLLSLINSILDFSKFEAGRMELVSEEYSMTQLIYDLKSMVGSRTEFDKLELQFDIAKDIPSKLYGDNVRLKQVIINLLTNAAKYTDEGSVKLSMYGKKHDGQVHLLVSVKDTGIGIKEEDQKILTERFTRFDAKRNHNVEGTGLGLNLVTGILELMDSELHVISTYGEGSEFYFEIEQDVADETPIGEIDMERNNFEEEEYVALFTAPDAEILVVDDNQMNLNVFENLLKETEVRIDKATSGQMAIDMTLKKKYDLIFMDHMMPEMDGVEAFGHIRENAENINKDTAVIILTANAVKGAEEEYRSLGFTDFLSKPIQPEILESKIAEHVDASKIKLNNGKKKENKKEEIKLPEITGMDAAYGVEHTGGAESLITVMKQFNSMAASEMNTLKGFYDELVFDGNNKEAVQNYRIKVHAMKSTSNVIGALQLSGVAAMLEKAAGDGKVKEIVEVTPYFEEAWNSFNKSLSEYFGVNEESATPVDKGLAEELIHQLDVSMQSFNIKNIDSVMEKLSSFGWNEEEKKIIDELKGTCTNLDAANTTRLCEELLKLIK